MPFYSHCGKGGSHYAGLRFVLRKVQSKDYQYGVELKGVGQRSSSNTGQPWLVMDDGGD